MAEATRKFLDYSGLSTLWSIINGKFATKDEAIGKISIEDGLTPAISKQVVYETVNGAQTVLTLEGASDEKAGLMSADHFKIVDELQYNIESMAPFAGLKIDGNEVSLTGRRANIELRYESSRNANGTANNAYISLVDADYPATGSWSETTEADYLANNATIAGRYAAVQDGDVITYYKWSEESAGPVNSLGVPLFNTPISKIDVTELVKSGMLISSDVVVNPEGYAAGTYLELVFSVASDSTDGSTNTVYFNVTDLVELYTAGEGITITHEGTNADDVQTTGTISVVTATDTALGAIKLGYTGTGAAKTYAVQLDTNNHAYVAVPWETIKVTAGSTAVNGKGEPYLVANVTTISSVDTYNNPVVTYDVNVEAGEGLKTAEALAKSSVQGVTGQANYVDVDTTPSDWGSSVVVSLNASATDSLALADAAVQVIKTDEYLTATQTQIAGATQTKGSKQYDIALTDSTKASLALADSALQSINMMGTPITKEDNDYTAAEAKVAMSIGTAAGVNYTDDTTLKTATLSVTGPTGGVDMPTVATTEAVKTYVDTQIENLKTTSESYVATVIDGLDSSLETKTTDDNAWGEGVSSTMMHTKIVIENGKLVAQDAYALKINDITDFAPLSDDDINKICGVTA